ncbi:hypothetical protein FACS1894172_03000 [Spirochaetia bacterium]|nr:hypothetical protein FACS1894172_03000 [Spirochaetia bacterium]
MIEAIAKALESEKTQEAKKPEIPKEILGKPESTTPPWEIVETNGPSPREKLLPIKEIPPWEATGEKSPDLGKDLPVKEVPPWEGKADGILSLDATGGTEGANFDKAKPCLTEDEKAKVREAHPDWPPEIIDAIGSWKEYEIYDKAGLDYAEINGKPCLIRPDIDMNQKDEYGRTNKERMEQGLAPLDKNGNSIELHHIGQKPDSPLAELTQKEHRGRGNDTILHDKTKPTEIDRGEFQKEKENHWETRAGEK